jgi:hypothetical protein
MPSNVPFSWFDVVVAVMVIIGVLRGRRRGMSQELLDFFMWLGMVGGGAYVCRAASGHMIRLTGLSQMNAQILLYLGTAAAVAFVFMLLKNAFKDRLAGTDFFGRLEYPLGILAGITRFLCMVLLVIAIINARFQTEAEKQAARKAQEAELGSSFFPTLGDIQDDIFKRSLIGSQLVKHAPFLLVPPSQPKGADAGKKDPPARSREREWEKNMK